MEPQFPSTSSFPTLAQQLDLNFQRTQKRYQTQFPNPPPPPLLPASHFFVTAAADTTQCPLCALTFPTSSQLLSHISLAHPNAYCHTSLPVPVAQHVKDRAFFCEICLVQCETNAQYLAHQQGQKHAKKMEIHNAFMKKSQSFAEEGVRMVENGVWMCDLCNVPLEGKNEILQHLTAGKHNRNKIALASAKQKKRERTDAAVGMSTAMPNTTGNQTVASNPHLAQPLQPVTEANTVPAPALFISAPFSIWSTPAIAKDPHAAGASGANAANVSVANVESGKMPSTAVMRTTSRTAGRDDGSSGGDEVGKRRVENSAKKHLLTEKRITEFTCELCGVTCNSMESMNAHLASLRHRKKLHQETPGTDGGFYCKICNVACCGRDNFEAHLKGKPHARRLRLNGGGE